MLIAYIVSLPENLAVHVEYVFFSFASGYTETSDKRFTFSKMSIPGQRSLARDNTKGTQSSREGDKFVCKLSF